MDKEHPRELPGFKKKSLLLPYGGSEIWFEHLDGLYGNVELALEKLAADRSTYCRPSYPSQIGFVLNETIITPEIIGAIAASLLDAGKVFSKVCFIGSDRQTEKSLCAALKRRTFLLSFFHDFEKAKAWLVLSACKAGEVST